MESLILIPEHYYTDDVKLEHILKRIAQIVEGNDSFHKRDDDTGWNIGQGNNWWLIHRPEAHVTGTSFFLSFRYARSKEWMDKVVQVVAWLAELEHFQVRGDLYFNSKGK